VADLIDIDVIEKILKDYMHDNATSESASAQTDIDMQDVQDDFKSIVAKHIKTVIPSFDENGIITDDARSESDVDFAIEFAFTDESVHRDSLYPAGYPQGTDPYGGIVLMFHKGWNAQNYAYGVWQNHGDARIRSLKSRTATGFLNNAIKEFNAKYASEGIYAKLIDEYSG